MKYLPSDNEQFYDDWCALDKAFLRWFNGHSWDDQKTYLIEQIRRRFGLPRKVIVKVFAQFDDIFSSSSFWNQEWDRDQSPVLRALVGRAIQDDRA
jgi:hypothetical protein